MKTQILKYLLIEHLPLLVNSYENAFGEIGKEKSNIFFDGEIITSLEGITLQELLEKESYHYILINTDFAPWRNQTYKTPLAFLVRIRKHQPHIRVMVSFQRASVCAFREVYSQIAPDCMVEATDCTSQTVRQAISHLIAGEVFYSKTILELFQLFIKANHFLDGQDYEILRELSIGTPIKELPDKINLSATTIFKRRMKLKLFFQVDGQHDTELIKRAKEQRFIY